MRVESLVKAFAFRPVFNVKQIIVNRDPVTFGECFSLDIHKMIVGNSQVLNSFLFLAAVDRITGKRIDRIFNDAT